VSSLTIEPKAHPKIFILMLGPKFASHIASTERKPPEGQVRETVLRSFVDCQTKNSTGIVISLEIEEELSRVSLAKDASFASEVEYRRCFRNNSSKQSLKFRPSFRRPSKRFRKLDGFSSPTKHNSRYEVAINLGNDRKSTSSL
jgi:hypothetical protein